MEIQGHDFIGSRALEEFSDEETADRIARIDDAVLAGIAEIRDEDENAFGFCVMEGIDKNKEVKDPLADRRESRMNNETILAFNGAKGFGKDFAIGEVRDLDWR